MKPILKPMRLPLLLLALHAAPIAADTTESSVRSIEALLEAYARGESAQSIEVLDGVLAPSFTMTAVLGDQVVPLSREEFLAGITAKRFGGNDNRLSIERVEIDGPTAAVRVRLQGSTARFHHFATAALVDGEWRLVHSLVTRTQPSQEDR